jgi:hypothetical protein|tara:strand:- start:4941 stop:5948 length:1008 start_codon:yes stop_codon:yes gene_type:complete
MAIEKVEYSFPHEGEEKDIEIESSSAVEIDLNPKKEEVKVEVEEPKKDEVEIEVVDDTPKADRNRKPSEPPEDVTDEELTKYSEQVQKRIRHFSKGYHDERRAKEQSIREGQELERLTKQLMQENDKLKGDLNKNQEALLKQAQQSVDTELLNAKEAYKKAYEAGDTDAVVAAQEALTHNKIRADKLKDIKIPPLQEQDSDVKQNVDTAPTAPKVDDKALQWSKKNPWFGTDDEMTSLAMGVHARLHKQGVDLQSDEYYEAINTRMREVFPNKFEDANEPEVEESKKQTNVVAPAARSVAPKKIRLSQTQVALAKKLGVPLELYAQKVAEEMRKS